MKKVLAIGFVATILAGCGVNNSANVDFKSENIAYKFDSRTELCYAVTASRKTGEFDTTGIGMAHVPCTKEVMNLVD